MNIIQIIETFFIAVVVAYALSPFIKKAAVKLDYVDHPKDNKVHAHPTPLLGGVAIFLAFSIAVLTKTNLMASGQVKAMMAGCLLLLTIGLIDDKVGMMPELKLLGQFLAALIAIKAGVRAEFLGNYYFNVIFTYFWIIGITNAFNLLDNMNGLSSGIASIAAAFLGVVAYMNGQPMICALSFALAGATLGFLKHNFPKANIFMGDVGSLIIGYILATLSVLISWKTNTWTTSLMIPLLILGYPIFDTTLVTVMRILEGRSIFEGGKDHSSHRLALLGFKKYGAVLVIYFFCLFLGLMGIAVTKVSTFMAMIFGAFAFIVMLSLGVYLSFIDTKRYGRKKGAYNVE
jgi:UDP-GlcNAc:undecaprenyl-phosphate GlcNAc-1-phosphate transferase